MNIKTSKSFAAVFVSVLVTALVCGPATDANGGLRRHRPCYPRGVRAGDFEITIHEAVILDSWTTAYAEGSDAATPPLFKLSIGSSDPDLVDRISVTLQIGELTPETIDIDAKGTVVTRLLAGAPTRVRLLVVVDFTARSAFPQLIRRFDKVADATGLVGLFDVNVEQVTMFVDVPHVVIEADYLLVECGYAVPNKQVPRKTKVLSVKDGKLTQASAEFMLSRSDPSSNPLLRIYGKVQGRDTTAYSIIGREQIGDIGVLRLLNHMGQWYFGSLFRRH